MTYRDGTPVRLSNGNWIGLAVLVLSVIGSVIYQTNQTAALNAMVKSHDQRISRLENVTDARHP